jgi:hypothetical protein
MNSAQSLGSSEKPWKDLYLSPNTFYIGGKPISVNSSGDLIVDNQTISRLTTGTYTFALGSDGGLTWPGGAKTNWPTNDGGFLKNNGSGTLSWENSIENSFLKNSSITINNVEVSLGGSIAVSAGNGPSGPPGPPGPIGPSGPGSSGGTPAGGDRQIQFNNNNAFGADGRFLIDGNGRVKIAGREVNGEGITNENGALGALEIFNRSNESGGAAMMTFLRNGIYGCYFGLDTDNQIAAGGWSAGAGNLTWAKFGGLGVGRTADGAGSIHATNNITADGNLYAGLNIFAGGRDGGLFLNSNGSYSQITGTNYDNATSVEANLKIYSWYGIGFGPNIGDQPVPAYQNALWMNVRNGEFYARGNITAYSSDQRLKNNFQPIQNSLDKLEQIGGYEFDWDMDKCRSLGFAPAQMHEHGVKAQEIQKVVSDAVTLAPFDDNGGESRTGENYLTVKYERLVPLLIEAIKELNAKVEELKKKLP